MNLFNGQLPTYNWTVSCNTHLDVCYHLGKFSFMSQHATIATWNDPNTYWSSKPGQNIDLTIVNIFFWLYTNLVTLHWHKSKLVRLSVHNFHVNNFSLKQTLFVGHDSTRGYPAVGDNRRNDGKECAWAIPAWTEWLTRVWKSSTSFSINYRDWHGLPVFRLFSKDPQRYAIQSLSDTKDIIRPNKKIFG